MVALPLDPAIKPWLKRLAGVLAPLQVPKMPHAKPPPRQPIRFSPAAVQGALGAP
jgi:hypothetical protein